MVPSEWVDYAFLAGLVLGGPVWLVVLLLITWAQDFVDTVERKWRWSSWRKAIRQSRIKRLRRKAKKLEEP